jgi:hypothetical protein
MTQNTQQRVFSVARQVLAVASAVMGVLTASVSQLHLPPEVSSVLVIAGGPILPQGLRSQRRPLQLQPLRRSKLL